MTSVRYEMVFTGRVQGVGFRATAEQIARRHGVTGWVRNEPDGTVRCVAEGPPPDVDAFVGELQNRMSGFVSDVRIDRGEPTGEFDAFEIWY